MRIILVGYGVVGRSLSKLLSIRSRELVQKYGLNPRIVAIAEQKWSMVSQKGLDLNEIQAMNLEKGNLVSGEMKHVASLDLIRDLDAEVVIEATPTNIRTGEPGLSHIETAIKSKKHVITTNKGPLALALPALLDLARHNGVHLLFSGTVGGGTPILDFGRRCLAVDRIVSIQGILNGTTNFILTKMEEGMDFHVALKLAQNMGYAEAEPSLDIDGWDTTCKIVILANWLLHKEVTLKDVKVEGIRNIRQEDIRAAAEKESSVKLIGSINGGIEVKPQMVKKSDPMCIGGTLNAVRFVSEFAGEEVIIGKGAGGMETASAILRDLLEIRERIA